MSEVSDPGYSYGVGMTHEILDPARANAAPIRATKPA